MAVTIELFVILHGTVSILCVCVVCSVCEFRLNWRITHESGYILLYYALHSLQFWHISLTVYISHKRVNFKRFEYTACSYYFRLLYSHNEVTQPPN